MVVGLVLLVCGLGAYAAARTTSAFEVRGVVVHGAPADVGADVRTALAGITGQSLLELDLHELRRVVEAVPSVAAVGFDRAFPHTLDVHVVPEVPVAVARRGSGAWLVASSGRVIGKLTRGSALPRIWLRRSVSLSPGARLDGAPLRAARAVAPLAGLRLPRVAAVRASQAELTLVLRSGTEIRLGDATDRALKLTIALRILPSLEANGGYVDVSVPERPVVGTTLESQVEVEPSASEST